MALQLDYYSEDLGMNIPSSYAKIDAFSGNATSVSFTVYFYTSQQARIDGKRTVGVFNFTIPYSDGMSIGGIYTYMKTLAEFAGAVDV
jgi:hypothetical protein